MNMLRLLQIGCVCIGVTLIAGEPAARAESTVWHIKGIHPRGHLLDIKAVDADGKLYDVKGFERKDNPHMLDVKALVGKRRHPVKVVVSDDRYAPVRALDVAGKNLDIKAVTSEGRQLDVKAVRRSGSILHIKVIGIGGRFYAVKALAPDGRVYDVKGIKMLKERREMLIGTVQVHAHVKALPQTGGAWSQ